MECKLRFFIIIFFVLFSFVGIRAAIPIDTPDFDERNDFVIRYPQGWGYRTFKGQNGLIGVMWPSDVNFHSTELAVFIFLQDDSRPIPKIPCNINLFTEKCNKAKFMFATKSNAHDPTFSLGEKYFQGRCGKTMVILKESVPPYNIIILIASAKYITKKQLSDLKIVAKNYRKEIEQYVKSQQLVSD